jgi:hypothetical protein
MRSPRFCLRIRIDQEKAFEVVGQLGTVDLPTDRLISVLFLGKRFLVPSIDLKDDVNLKFDAILKSMSVGKVDGLEPLMHESWVIDIVAEPCKVYVSLYWPRP